MSNRRDFIKKAGMGFALAGISGSSMAQVAGSAIKQGSTTDFNVVNGAEKVVLKVTKPLFCPYYSISTPAEKGGGAHYYRNDAFNHNPFTVPASGMSGSPIIMDANGKFVGFMTTFAFENSTFSFDGVETLTITVPQGQELFIDESGIGDEAWKAYNSEMMSRLDIKPMIDHPRFWADVEYCTWVEQKFLSTKGHEHFNLLNHNFIANYLDKIIEYGYPKGKMTLDHGWGTFPDGTINSGFGSWTPDPKKFPDFRKTMDMITEKGFTPGLWIGFPKIHAASTMAKRNPNMLGSWRAGEDSNKSDDIRWLNPKSDIFEYASETIDRFYKMGVMKFKIDMSYNTKSDMLHIHKELYKAAKCIDENIEMEFHVPDIFFTKFTDVTRTNDVWLNDKFDWPARVKTHYAVSLKSSPGRGINLDHIGGNDTGALTEEKYLQHLEMYKSKIGYPCISLLPHHISQKCVDETGKYLWAYENGNKKIISDFYNKK
ncbi:twin-arginine translocation signal domain-containing protein [Labilibaculum antarcticum]|uniref:Glycoside hydrolase n=1 Tax=Labilibaculum antarcticum TaxID=1717717 RepID=A0A1Y1CFF7_9BACT|nr:twin-arginine translocation signal domain-containing protein [Labilibaculum antarcticum]BAX79087.1 glycoside hydrolase [Labilibaculum antarcticum]